LSYNHHIKKPHSDYPKWGSLMCFVNILTNLTFGYYPLGHRRTVINRIMNIVPNVCHFFFFYFCL